MKYENEYTQLLREGLFEDLFLTVDKNISLVENKVEQRKQVREFIKIINDNFENILQAKNMQFFAKEFVHAFRDLPVLQDAGKNLEGFASERISLLFSYLILAGDLNNAKFLLPNMNRNLEVYPQTLNSVIEGKNTDKLRFICENMENIHYNEEELLRKCHDLPLNTIVSLIEDFDFDLNGTNKNVTSSLMTQLVVNKNTKNFRGLVERYADKINWAQNYSLDSGMTIFDIIDNTSIPLSFYSIILEKRDLRGVYVERIANTLLKKENEDLIKAASNTDIYEKLFNHPNFNHETTNLDQGFCLYGLLNRIGVTAAEAAGKDEGKIQASKAYLRIIESFINSRQDDEMPDASAWHIVGAAIHVAKETNEKYSSQETIDACGLILRKYRHYINKTNPDKSLPITQVDDSSVIYRMLLNNGAIAPPPETFWNSIINKFGFGKNKTLREQIVLEEEEKRRLAQTQSPEPSYGSFTSLKAQMRDDFRKLRQELSNPLCHDVIRLRCENMFLAADDLVNKMEKYKLDNTTEDVFFLSQNFSNYLNKSLSSYLKVCEATVDFAQEDEIQKKLRRAKEDCLEAIELLDKQINLITNSVFGRVHTTANNSVRVNKKFLESRLDSSDTLEDLDKKFNELTSVSDANNVNNANNINTVNKNPHINQTNANPSQKSVSILDEMDALKEISTIKNNANKKSDINDVSDSVIDVLGQNSAFAEKSVDSQEDNKEGTLSKERTLSKEDTISNRNNDGSARKMRL